MADLRNNSEIEKFDLKGKKIKEENEQDKLVKALKEAKKATK